MKFSFKALASRPFMLRVPLQEKILFVRHLSIALKAGLSLIDSIELIRKQTKNRGFKRILEVLINDVKNGVFLSESLKSYERLFGELFINIIKVAEASGTLPESLLYLAQELQKKRALKKKVRGAMIYPMVILATTIVIAVGMIFFIFPKILPIFSNLKTELPLTTRMLIGLSDLITHYGIWVFAAAVAVIIGFRFLMRLATVRYWYHRFLFVVPIFGVAMINFNIANFTRTLGVLLKSGVHIIEALGITSHSLVNLVYQKHLRAAAEGVGSGAFVSVHLKKHPRYFPLIAANMIEIGENTGNLAENLNYLAEFYEGEVDDFVKNLSNILEPILLLFMGGIVGFIALSFITPLYQLSQGLR